MNERTFCPSSSGGAKSYSVILTDGDGTPVYVACLSFLEPVPSAARAAHPALRSACARKCVCLVSRAPILDTLRGALRAIYRACFLRPRRDAPPLVDVVAAIVDGLPAPGDRFARNTTTTTTTTATRTPATLFSVCGRPLVLPAVGPYGADDDDVGGGGGGGGRDGRGGGGGGAGGGGGGFIAGATAAAAAAAAAAAGDGDDDGGYGHGNGVGGSGGTGTGTSGSGGGGGGGGYGGGGDDDAVFEPLLRALGPRNVARAVCAVAAERRVLLRSRQLSLLVAAAQGLLAALQPMRWRHVYIPLLPHALVDYVEAPTPFVMGLHADVDVAPDALAVGRRRLNPFRFDP